MPSTRTERRRHVVFTHSPRALPAAIASACAVLALLAGACAAAERGNLLEDPSFEQSKDKDRFGLVFEKWGGWKYEGDCDFGIGRVARTGKTSCLLVGGAGAKIRVAQLRDLEPGRYRITAYVRGLDVGRGTWNASTEFMFDDKYMQLNKDGTFGWTRLTYVAELKQKKKAGPSFGLMAPGRFWIDDVSLERVGPEVPLTPAPILGKEESPISPPREIGASALRCSECGYRNPADAKSCYACGEAVEAQRNVAAGPSSKAITSFEDKNPFSGGQIVGEHATEGARALRIDKSYLVMDQPQNWLGYDYLKADLYTDAKEPLRLSVEIRDRSTRDYWTRVNYETVVPPGASTLILPVQQLYVGEKSRPGRALVLDGITAFVLSIGDTPAAPLFVDNLRLERDDTARRAGFEGLFAFDFGPATSPVLEGFTAVTPGTLYSRGRGYGLLGAKVWRAFDALQPDPLYRDFLCIESGGLAIDVPNGRYRVFVNLDSPSGFWGEYQTYRKRIVRAEGKPVVSQRQDFATLKQKYFRFWNVEDRASENTFDKYQAAYFQEQQFEVDVTDGQLNLEFEGEAWACCVSAVVVFPVAKATEGERFLQYTREKRRFHFDNFFKRILHASTGEAIQPTAEDQRRGYVCFQRDAMQDVYDNDTPVKSEMVGPLAVEAFAGEYEPLTVGLVPLVDLGKVRVKPSALAGPAGTIPAEAIEVGYVSYRLSRVTMDGSVYTIAPRWIMPGGEVAMPKGITRRFWLTVKVPATAAPGVYRGSIAVEAEKGGAARLLLSLRVRAGKLDAVDVPAGPWGYTINVPSVPGDSSAAAENQAMALQSLRKMREYGFTTFSGIPSIAYQGFQSGKPVLDFRAADPWMKTAKQLGFLAVISYGGGVSGINAYYQDAEAMRAAGFQSRSQDALTPSDSSPAERTSGGSGTGTRDYAAFVRAVYTAVEEHAKREAWIPVYYNLGDEPLGDDLVRAAENAEAYRKAFPKGPPWFTAATSFAGDNREDPHFRFSRALHVANWNLHDETSVKLLHQAGGNWAFYNGGNRWTFGAYMYKAAKQFDMKFRISWHWNASAGDPYYALDCREDDYAWCQATPDGRLISAVDFERLREGLDDYRRLVTLARLAQSGSGSAAAKRAEALLQTRLGSFHLGQRDHEALFRPTDWSDFRRTIDDAIEALQ